MTVEADPAQDSQLRAGQFVNLDIVTEVLEGRLALPRTALVLDGPVPRAFRVVDGRAEELTVTMGPSHGERVEILSGIEAGDTVVVVGQHNLRQGLPVSVMEIDGVLVSERPETPVLTREEASVERRAERFRVVEYDTARGCAAAYFPETNVLVPLDDTAIDSGTPVYKSVVVRLEPTG